ncbi:hypothetical protein [Compostibacter hankyongensis]
MNKWARYILIAGCMALFGAALTSCGASRQLGCPVQAEAFPAHTGAVRV